MRIMQDGKCRGPFDVHLVFPGGGGARDAMLAPFRADWAVETPLNSGIVGYGGPRDHGIALRKRPRLAGAIT